MKIVWALILFTSQAAMAGKEIALTFDDAPVGTTAHFESQARTHELIRKLHLLNVPPVLIFSNPCKRADTRGILKQLKLYRSAGHFIGNHTCSHPRLDTIGIASYAADAEKADVILNPLFQGQKFFRFPFLNEGTSETLRDQMREWLANHHYRNGMVSVDNDDYQFSFKMNEAKRRGLKIDYRKTEALFVKHLVGAATYYDDLAIKTLGRSPKHVMLLHEMDATVMFIEPLVKALRAQGWKFISVSEAYEDPIYRSEPKNFYSGDGIIAQLDFEKTKNARGYKGFTEIEPALNEALGL